MKAFACLLLLSLLAAGCASSALDDAVRAEATYYYLNLRYERDCRIPKPPEKCSAFYRDTERLHFETRAANRNAQVKIKKFPPVQRKALRQAEKKASAHVD